MGDDAVTSGSPVRPTAVTRRTSVEWNPKWEGIGEHSFDVLSLDIRRRVDERMNDRVVPEAAAWLRAGLQRILPEGATRLQVLAVARVGRGGVAATMLEKRAGLWGRSPLAWPDGSRTEWEVGPAPDGGAYVVGQIESDVTQLPAAMIHADHDSVGCVLPLDAGTSLDAFAYIFVDSYLTRADPGYHARLDLAPRIVDAGGCLLSSTGWSDERDGGVDVFGPRSFVQLLEQAVVESQPDIEW